MFTQEIYDQALMHFEKTDKPFYNLLKKHGLLNDAPNHSLFVNMTRCILTQWIYFTKSTKIRAKLTENIGNDFAPIDIIKLGASGLINYGADPKIANRAVGFAEYCLENPFSTIEDIFNIDMNGIGVWTKNVCAVTYSLCDKYPGYPHNSLTTGDPVIRKGVWSLHGIEAYNSYIDELNVKHKPWGGLLTWYLWREFNYKSIKVPRTYIYWNRSISPKPKSKPKLTPTQAVPKIYHFFERKKVCIESKSVL